MVIPQIPFSAFVHGFFFYKLVKELTCSLSITYDMYLFITVSDLVICIFKIKMMLKHTFSVKIFINGDNNRHKSAQTFVL